MKKHNVAVVGVGAVGIEMLRCLAQRKFPVGELRVFARSARDMVKNADEALYFAKQDGRNRVKSVIDLKK